MDLVIEALTKRFKEAATTLSADDIRRRLSDTLREQNTGGSYCYICDVFGDDDSGDVVYSCDGCLYKAPYSMGSVSGKPACNIDMDSAVEVWPQTVYQEKPDDDDHMTAMESVADVLENGRRFALGLFERFISKDERASMDKADFAGKGTSFPIKKPGDVMAAVRAIGRAGSSNYSADVIKKNIKSIAKRKGFPIPDAWKDSDNKVAAAAREIPIDGEYVALREGAVGQDGTAYLKLIAPGWGSSGHYSKELLKRDGPTIFKAGLKNYWNHPTAAEESARPEGDLRDVVSVLSEDAHYEENGPAGAGLYAKAQVMPHYREHVDSLAKHIGMSIRAMGQAKEGTADGKKGTIIEKLTRAQSVDYVTEPGAGGKVLQLFEAARAAHQQGETDMDEATVQRLIEAGVQKALAPIQAENKALLERLTIVTEAPRVLKECLDGVNLPAASAKRVSEVCLASIPLKDGKLDEAEFKKVVEAQVKKEGAFLAELSGGRFVVGMGTTAATVDPKVIKERADKEDEEFEETMKEMADIFVVPQTGDDKEARKQRRKNFMEGRAA